MDPAICRRAGLPERGWHVLRHSFGTHAAMFGVNPWRLQTWMGHKRIDETMLYVNFAGNHLRQLPPTIITAPPEPRSTPTAHRRDARRAWHCGGTADGVEE